MNDKISKKQMLEKKENKKNEAQILSSINTFISSSKRLLDVLHSLPIDKKKEITLNVAEITKVCSQMSKIRALELASYNLQVAQLNLELALSNKSIEDLKSNKNTCGLLEYHKNKRQLVKKTISIKRHIKDSEKLISSCNSELDTYRNALNICSEFGRRLSFYLSYEE